MCSEAIKTDIDLLLEDLGSVENLNHECIILYDNHVCKVFNKDYTVNEDNVLLFDSLLDWRETALNTYQLKSLLSSLVGTDTQLLFTAYDGSTHGYVTSYMTNKYSDYGVNVRVIAIGDKTKNIIGRENHDIDVEEGRMYEDKITMDFNRGL